MRQFLTILNQRLISFVLKHKPIVYHLLLCICHLQPNSYDWHLLIEDCLKVDDVIPHSRCASVRDYKTYSAQAFIEKAYALPGKDYVISPTSPVIRKNLPFSFRTIAV